MGRRSKPRVVSLVSAGGVVYRRGTGGIETVLCGRSLSGAAGGNEEPRLEREGRLIQGEDAAKGVNQTNLLNFKPTRPIRDIANEYVDAFCALYEPNAYMDRVYSYYLKMGAPRWKAAAKLPSLVDLKALTIVVWRQGIKRNTRTRFWRYLLGMARNNPALLEQFLSVLAHNEHFLEYRSIVQQEIREQLESLPPEEPTPAKELKPA